MKFFTADAHIGHYNILKYQNRPFASIEEHDRVIIDNINDAVGRHDELYILGDLTFKGHKEILDKIRCKQIYMLAGNHDQKSSMNAARFKWIKDLVSIYDGEQQLVLCHYPLASWHKARYGSIMLHGHVHNMMSHSFEAESPNRVDVGVDGWGYKPCNLAQIVERIKSRKPNENRCPV